METAIQLLLFSQPQPLVVVVHSGKSEPYQLHCCPLAVLLATLLDNELDLELATELTSELDLELAAELITELAAELLTELATELDEFVPLQVDDVN